MIDFDLKQELLSVATEEFREAISELIDKNEIKTNGELILSLCNMINEKLNILERQQYFKSTQTVGTLYRKKNDDISQSEEQEIMIFGAKLIYLLRIFITNEEITYHMATKSKDGKYSASAFVPQSQVMANLSTINGCSVGLSQAMQKNLIEQNQQNDFMDIKRKNLWNRVEYLSEPKYLPGRNIGKIDLRKGNSKEAHWAYQNQKKDMQIYLKFYGANHKIEKYYDLEGNGKRDSLMHFNNGWLWEWYNSVLYGGSNEEYEFVTESLQKGSLRPIMKGKDFTPGTKQGDFKDLKNRQIQSKYANQKIISYNNIRHIIFDLKSALQAYLQESEQREEKIINVLQEHFFPDSAEVGNKFAKDVAEELLAKIKMKI